MQGECGEMQEMGPGGHSLTLGTENRATKPHPEVCPRLQEVPVQWEVQPGLGQC